MDLLLDIFRLNRNMELIYIQR